MYFEGVNRGQIDHGSDMECLLARNTLWRVAFANYVGQTIESSLQNFENLIIFTYTLGHIQPVTHAFRWFLRQLSTEFYEIL